jgi:alpha-L-arabinofuranosidase
VSATRDTPSGDVILKLVNIQATAQPLQINLRGVGTIKKDAAGEMITGALGDVNTVAEPMKVVSKPFTIKDAGSSFAHELPAHSVSVIRLKAR